MNIIILSEGHTELGKSYLNRDFLSPVPYEELGALEMIIVRMAAEVLKKKLIVMGLPQLPLTSPGHVSRASLTQVIQDTYKLKQMLLPCFNPPRQEMTVNAVQGAIIACDERIHVTVSRSVRRVLQSINKKIIHITFRPEFEVVLLEREAIEQAANLPNNSVKIPDGNDVLACGGLKEAFVHCVMKAGYHDNPPASSSDFKVKVAQCLSTGYLACKNLPIFELRKCISELIAK